MSWNGGQNYGSGHKCVFGKFIYNHFCSGNTKRSAGKEVNTAHAPLPVDSHHHRIAQRLGLIPEKVGLGPTHKLLEAQLPDGGPAVYNNYEMPMLHKQNVCHHRKPKCERCVVLAFGPDRAATASKNGGSSNPMQRHRNFWLLLAIIILLLAGCATQGEEQSAAQASQSIADETIAIQDLDIATGQTIFVPAYSEVRYAANGRTTDLAVTLSVHNTDFTNAIILTSVRYYNTQGELVREYLPEPLSLGPLASADFFVEEGDQGSGVGTNFIVEWVAEEPVYEPIVETLMLSVYTRGLSFTSPGRVISQVE